MTKININPITGIYIFALLISFILQDNYRIKQDLIIEKILTDTPF